ncbi:MAG: hypothetical protein KJZ86_24280 [Caldilineaceae bacterium]|nr:hypothetical protein [Caldilineaceae bacterium]HRJ42642.1 PEP-utilizing enzyme [Caldilineaceae bacterium]
MYDYISEQAKPAGNRGLWTRNYFYPFVSVFSPFSYSVLAEISRRAWFHYYSRLGADIAFVPRTLIRNEEGRPYLDLQWICEQDAAFAGIEPLALRLNGKPVTICPWEKPGLLTAFKLGRNQKKVADLLQKLPGEMQAITERIRGWHSKVRAMRWSQAEILQIMEEIERFGAESLMAYFAARHNLERAHNGLLSLLSGDSAHRLHLINSTLSDVEGLRELSLTGQLLTLARQAAKDQRVMQWLAQGSEGNLSESIPAGPFADGLSQLLAEFGHWVVGLGEMSHPTWAEEAELLLAAIQTCALAQVTSPNRAPSAGARQQLLNAVNGKSRKEAEALLESVRSLQLLQSEALHAFGYLLAGTRVWALAAGNEAAADGRLLDPQDVFLFELEEIKQMMTGEWNVTSTDEIHARVESRRADYARWQGKRGPAAYFGDAPAWMARSGLPSVAGRVTGPLRRQTHLRPLLCQDAIIGARRVDSSWAATLPLAGGFVAAAGSPLDPIIAAARAWHVPAVVGLGAVYDELVDGAQTVVDGSAGVVEQ